ncbi:uncharacterized protein M6G45_009290 [Spheniscus humboldti]
MGGGVLHRVLCCRQVTKMQRRNQRPPGRRLPPAAGKRKPASLGEEGSFFIVRSRSCRQRAPQGLYVSPAAWWRAAKRPELQKRKGGEKEKETSKLANTPSSAKSESCGEAWALPAPPLAPPLFFFASLYLSLFFCPAPFSCLLLFLLFYHSLFFFSLCFCPAPSPSFFFHFILCLCPVGHRCFFHLFVLLPVLVLLSLCSASCPFFLSCSISLSCSLSHPHLSASLSSLPFPLFLCLVPSLVFWFSVTLYCSLSLIFACLSLCPAPLSLFFSLCITLSCSLSPTCFLYPSLLPPVLPSPGPPASGLLLVTVFSFSCSLSSVPLFLSLSLSFSLCPSVLPPTCISLSLSLCP